MNVSDERPGAHFGGRLVRSRALLAAASLVAAGPALAGGDRDQDCPGCEELESMAFALPNPPPPEVYDGPLFELSHDYPKRAKRRREPWRKAIDYHEINVSNAYAYVEALKDYVAEDMQVLLFDYENWDAAERGWYNQPWLSTIREPIHGTYVGSTFPAEMFPRSGLTESMTTHVLVYYDPVAATSLRKVWGRSAVDPLPGLELGGGQFPEGSIIVKPAFTTAGGDAWPPIEDAFPWQIYAAPGDGTTGDPELQDVYFFQFDIIVKDSKSSPQSQWVFTTLVYDQSVEGDLWDKMVPLGAMWGNDPGVTPPVGNCYEPEIDNCPPLHETWINAAAPAYSKETLGWGGRLSGPNDGAVDISAVVQSKSGSTLTKVDGRFAMSSCMSCHGVAEFEMESFLLPGPADCDPERDDCTPTFASCDDQGQCELVPPGPGVDLVYFQPGSREFSRWFQSRPGDEPQDLGTIPLDYGMNYAFKAIPLWLQEALAVDANFVEEFNNYRGLRYDD